MTVTYSQDVATAKLLTLGKLLFTRWRGSVIKLIWRDVLVLIVCYYTIFALNKLLVHFNYNFLVIVIATIAEHQNMVPIAFILGFFINNIMDRWWKQYMSIPWPYRMAVYVSSNVHGLDEVGRAMRRTIMRYVCLSLTMVFRVLSPRVQERFPSMSDLVGAGLLLESELKIIEELDSNYPGYGKNWLPIVWAASLVNRARSEGRISDDFAVKTLMDELNNFRGSCGTLMIYNTICIPLVYTQVVTIATHVFFAFSAARDLSSNYKNVPILLLLEFIFYMGWLKVAETMLNPFGNDDDDFEVNYLIDRNLQMCYLIVDEMHNEHPELLKDQYWDEMPQKLPGRKTSDEHRPTEPTDIFDVPEKPSGLTRRPTVFKIPSDEESLEDLFNGATQSTQDLQPHASVIDEFNKKAPLMTEPSSKSDLNSLRSYARPVAYLNNFSPIPEFRTISHASVSKDANLRPRASVIAKSYSKVPDVEQKQSLFQMAMSKRKTEIEAISMTNSRISTVSKDLKGPNIADEIVDDVLNGAVDVIFGKEDEKTDMKEDENTDMKEDKNTDKEDEKTDK